MQELNEFCQLAWELGKTIDLSGCKYGYHSRTKTQVGTSPYYYFLAGLARLVNAQQVLEIGTFKGGSARALSTGAPGARVVTVDISKPPPFSGYPGVLSLVGDSLNQVTAASVLEALSPPVDILFIDSHHSYQSTKDNFVVYKELLKPRFVVLDDISLNPEMTRLWEELQTKYLCCNVSGIVGRTCGFGLIRLSHV